MFLKFLGEVTSLVFRNDLRIILDSKSEKLKNIEAPNKCRHSYEKEGRTLISIVEVNENLSSCA